MTTLIERLAEMLQAVPDYKGRWHADCPQCGAAGTKHGRPAYHFYLYHLDGIGSGAQCQVCGYKTRLYDLARELGADGNLPMPAPRAEMRRPQAPWERPDAWQRWKAYYATRIDAIVRQWAGYRPFTAETVQRFGLAVDKLTFYAPERQEWYAARQPRLLVPIVREGQIIGIKGRAYHPMDDGPKWLSATNSQTWLCGVEDVQAGQEVIWCESLVDRLLGAQQYADLAFVATGGLTWRDEWLDRLAAQRPRHVLVWFDNDLSGNGNEQHNRRWLAEWRADINARRGEDAPGIQPQAPLPRGPQLVRDLRRRGVRADLYRWSADAPHKADLGWALMTEIAAKLPD